ncbi:MAG: hypothetical protein WBN22_03010 [Verrucomicrobiia bacterium]
MTLAPPVVDAVTVVRVQIVADAERKRLSHEKLAIFIAHQKRAISDYCSHLSDDSRDFDIGGIYGDSASLKNSNVKRRFQGTFQSRHAASG